MDLLHVLPRRTGAVEAGPGAFDFVLFDGFAGRGHRSGIRGAGGAGDFLRVLRATLCARDVRGACGRGAVARPEPDLSRENVEAGEAGVSGARDRATREPR